jgi:hypothetical protein
METTSKMRSETVTTAACENLDESSDSLLDVYSFPAFKPLLEACQEYARITGSRFPKGALKDLEENAGKDSKAVSELRKSAGVVSEFRSRLIQRDEGLIQCLKFAYQQVMTESVRNGIVATCRELDLWPPEPPPADVFDDDCAWQDLTVPLPIIAQRTFNDNVKRGQNQVLRPLHLQAITASFIVDFATDVGAASELSSPTDMHKEQLTEFMMRVDEWVQTNAASTGSKPRAQRARDAFVKGLGPGGVADNMRQQVLARWTKNWETPEGTVTNMAIIGLGAVALAAAVHRGMKRR